MIQSAQFRKPASPDLHKDKKRTDCIEQSAGTDAQNKNGSHGIQNDIKHAEISDIPAVEQMQVRRDQQKKGHRIQPCVIFSAA